MRIVHRELLPLGRPGKGGAAILAAAIVLVGQGTARATAKSWNVTSGSWNLGSNWSPSGVPGSSDDVTISTGTVTINANVGVNSMSISGGTTTVSGSSVTVATTAGFTVSGGTFTGGSAAANTITVGGSVAVSNTDASLIGYWKLDETASPAADSSATNAPATWSGPPTSSPSIPTVGFNDTQSLSMTGGQYAATTALSPNWPALQPATVTMSAWYKATNVDTSGAEIVSGGNIYALRMTSTGLSVIKRIAHNGTPTQDWVEYQVAPTGYLDGNWHQIVGIVDTDHSMKAYFDGAAISGTYYYNGTGGLHAVGSPPEVSALDYGSVGTYGLNIGRNPSTGSFDFGANCAVGACAIDDVRVYNRALSAGEISTLSAGSQPGTMTVAGPLSIAGSLTVQTSGTLTLSGANATITMASGQTLTMDGTLNSSTSAGAPTIRSASGTYHFYVGSSNGISPTLNISSLIVKNTDLNGMRIDGNGAGTTTATTTFKQFDGVVFSNGTTGANTTYLQIYAPTLYLTSNGCSFGVGEGAGALPAAAVKLTGNGFTNGATETRAIFGATSCADNWTGGGSDKICLTSAKSDDDNENSGAGNGIGDNTGTNGAVVQFVRAAKSDTKGTIEGFPTPAFDWNTFAYYSTYIAYHDADPSNTKDRVYVRQADGSAATSTYYWEGAAGETIVGTPRWTTVNSTHYLYVAFASGKVYQLVDDSSAHTLTTTGASWSTNPFTSATTITSPLALDASNVYVAGASSGNKVWSLKQTDGTPTTGSPFVVSAAVSSASPAVWTNAGDTYVTIGVSTANTQITNIDVTNSAMTFSNTVPAGNVSGRIGFGSKTSRTLFVSDDLGNMYGIDPTSASNVSRWSYAVGASTTIGPAYYDFTGDTLMFGTGGGKLYALSTASGPSVSAMTGYTTGFAPNSNTDAFSGAPLYYSGILLAGNVGGATTGGKLYVIDRNASASSPCTASGPNLLRQYNFGPNESVSGVGYNAASNRYMVTTSSTVSDGRLYYIDQVADPTAACN
jgi:hypothetical protein